MAYTPLYMPALEISSSVFTKSKAIYPTKYRILIWQSPDVHRIWSAKKEKQTGRG
jgi:hypothetical protein